MIKIPKKIAKIKIKEPYLLFFTCAKIYFSLSVLTSTPQSGTENATSYGNATLLPYQRRKKKEEREVIY